MIADAGAVPRQNPAHADLSLPVRRERLVMSAAAFRPPRRLPGGILQLLRKSKVQERGQRAVACPFLFPVVIPQQNSHDKGLPPCCGCLFQLKLPVRRQPRQGVWGGVKDYIAILFGCWCTEMCLETNMIYWPALIWCTICLMPSTCTNLLLSLGMRGDSQLLMMLLYLREFQKCCFL